MNQEDLKSLISEVFRFRAKIELDKKLENYTMVYPDTFYLLSSVPRGVDLIREQLEKRENIDILCLKEFLLDNQKGLPCISIHIKDDCVDNYKITFRNKTYFLSIKIDKVDATTDDISVDGHQSNKSTMNGKRTVKIIESAFKEIFEMETSRILKQQTKFYDFLQRTDDKAYANFFLGNYTEACGQFSKNEKRVYCEMMRNKRLSLDPDLFSYITGKDEENTINIDRLTLVFFIFLYTKITENYSHYAFLYHLVDFENEYINVVLSVEMARVMELLGSHKRKRLFLLYSAAKVLYDTGYFEKANNILRKHFPESVLYLESLINVESMNSTGKDMLQGILKQYHSNKNLNFELIDLLDGIPGIGLDVKLRYKLFKSYQNNTLPYNGVLANDEELIIQIYDDIEDAEIEYELVDSSEIENEGKLRIETNSTITKPVNYRVEKVNGCTNIYIQANASFLLHRISFNIPDKTVKFNCVIDKEVVLNGDAHFLKIVNQEKEVIFNAYQKAEFMLKVISNRTRMVTIRINERFKFDKLIEKGENAIKFDFQFEEGTHILIFTVRPTLYDYTLPHEETNDTYASAHRYELHAVVAKSLSLEINTESVLNCLEIKLKNFTERELSLKRMELLNNDYQMVGIGFARDRRERAEKIIEKISHELVLQGEDPTGTNLQGLSTTKNIPIDQFDSLVGADFVANEQSSVDMTKAASSDPIVRVESNSEKRLFLFFKRKMKSTEIRNYDKCLEQLVFNEEYVQQRGMDGAREAFIRNTFYLNGSTYSHKFANRILNFFASPIPYELPITFYFDGVTPFVRYGPFFNFSTGNFKNMFFKIRKNLLDWSNDKLVFMDRLNQLSDTPKAYVLNIKDQSYVLAVNPLENQLVFEIEVGQTKLGELILKPACMRLVRWQNDENVPEFEIKVKCLSGNISVVYVN
ncbi:hypothetical protein THOM_2440 [Trachipleistophora hominis]|uniref:Uncharacterized protein n=1 Tax=Trachipleistophora hominis TaxID=72359 RepID=L7JTD1_TRAHO|nr:hypothetical protein THOM_2440 [Trachipleistophora hominis]